MSSSSSNINFSFEYILSLTIVLVFCHSLAKTNPQMNTIVVVLAGIAVGFLVVYFLNTFYPTLNKTASNVYGYYLYQFVNSFNSTGYMHVWPPILVILLIFIILLYNRQLG